MTCIWNSQGVRRQKLTIEQTGFTMRTTVSLRALPRSAGTAALLLVTLLVMACGTDGPVSVDSTVGQTIAADAGAEIRITLGTVGPGEYVSPLSVSSPSVRFLDVSYVAPSVPAGVRQSFRFKAVSRGRAILVFQHTVRSDAVQDTVDVR